MEKYLKEIAKELKLIRQELQKQNQIPDKPETVTIQIDNVEPKEEEILYKQILAGDKVTIR